MAPTCILGEYTCRAGSRVATNRRTSKFVSEIDPHPSRSHDRMRRTARSVGADFCAPHDRGPRGDPSTDKGKNWTIAASAPACQDKSEISLSGSAHPPARSDAM